MDLREHKGKLSFALYANESRTVSVRRPAKLAGMVFLLAFVGTQAAFPPYFKSVVEEYPVGP